MESKTTSEQDALKNKIAQLKELQDSGVADLGKSIDNLRTELALLSVTTAGPDWTGLCELIEGGLDDATDEELRPLFLEYLESIVFQGNPKSSRSSCAARLAAMFRMAVAKSTRPPSA